MAFAGKAVLGAAAALAVVASAAAAVPAPERVPREANNVAAFTRLYGVVRYFYPADAVVTVDWDRFAVLGVSRVRGARDTAALEKALEQLFLSLGPGIDVGKSLPPAAAEGPVDAKLVAWRYRGPGIVVSERRSAYSALRTNRTGDVFELAEPGALPVSGAHADLDLGGGLRARVPLALTDVEARSSTSELLRTALQAVPSPAGRGDLDARLADVVVAWNVFRHFYPYWEEVGVDWDARLVPLLGTVWGASTQEAHKEALQQLVADVRDGHGSVREPSPATAGALPISLRVIEGRVVVGASGVSDVPVGAVVTAIGDVRAPELLQRRMRLASGTVQWRTWRATQRMTACTPGSTTPVTIATQTGTTREVTLSCGDEPPAERRPHPVAELDGGVRYVDLSRATSKDIAPILSELAAAPGVIFDLRGYPTDAGHFVLPYLLTRRENDRWMHIAKITGPFGQVSGWESMGWNLSPDPPRIEGRRVFLTDGRAISYAESVMGYIKDRKLATIVGGPTAGANGNVVSFAVPSGHTIRFTGMKVTRHDGVAPHHMVGVQPDVPLEPTLAGLREGRDEVLEKGIELASGPIRRARAPGVRTRWLATALVLLVAAYWKLARSRRAARRSPAPGAAGPPRTA